MTRSRLMPTLGAALLMSLVAVPAASAQEAGAELRVLHGIPGVPVDVYVDGELTLDDFEPGTTTDDLALPAGAYEVAVFAAADADDTGTPVIGPATLDVPESGNVSAVAHLTEDGTPTLTPFVNDTSAAAAGAGKVVVRHTAAAPTVDVLVNGAAALTGITNPGEQSAELPAGTVSAAVAATGTTEPVIGPADVPITAGEATIVYAIGSLEEDSLDLLVQTVPLDGGATAPEGVPAGAGGLLDNGVPTQVLVLTGAGVVVAVGAASVLARTRREQ